MNLFYPLSYLRESAKNNLPNLRASFEFLLRSSNPHVAMATLRFECLAVKQNNSLIFGYSIYSRLPNIEKPALSF